MTYTWKQKGNDVINNQRTYFSKYRYIIIWSCYCFTSKWLTSYTYINYLFAVHVHFYFLWSTVFLIQYCIHYGNWSILRNFVGGEWDYVIFSLVRSLPEYRIEKNPTLGWCFQNLGFIIDMHQINVALTRAKKGLFIIGRIYLNFCSRWYIIYTIL